MNGLGVNEALGACPFVSCRFREKAPEHVQHEILPITCKTQQPVNRRVEEGEEVEERTSDSPIDNPI